MRCFRGGIRIIGLLINDGRTRPVYATVAGGRTGRRTRRLTQTAASEGHVRAVSPLESRARKRKHCGSLNPRHVYGKNV